MKISYYFAKQCIQFIYFFEMNEYHSTRHRYFEDVFFFERKSFQLKKLLFYSSLSSSLFAGFCEFSENSIGRKWAEYRDFYIYVFIYFVVYIFLRYKRKYVLKCRDVCANTFSVSFRIPYGRFFSNAVKPFVTIFILSLFTKMWLFSL